MPTKITTITVNELGLASAAAASAAQAAASATAAQTAQTAAELAQSTAEGYADVAEGAVDLALSEARTVSGTWTHTSPVINGAVTGSAVATTAEAETGTANDQLMTPALVKASVLRWAGWQSLGLISVTNVANVSFHSYFDNAKFIAYEFDLMNVVPATDAVELRGLTSTNGGSSYDNSAGNYRYNIHTNEAVGGLTSTEVTTASWLAFSVNVGSATNEYGWSGKIRLIGPHRTTAYTRVTWQGCYNEATVGALTDTWGSGERQSAADVDGFRLYFSSGNIESGEILVSGLRRA